MNDKPKTRGRAATTRTRLAGATILRPRGEEAATPAKKSTRTRGPERASSLLRNRKAKTQDVAVGKAQEVVAPAEEPTVANPPETQATPRPPELQADEVKDKTAGQDKTVTEPSVQDTAAAVTKTDDSPVGADTDNVPEGTGSGVADASLDAASETAQSKPRARGTRKSSDAKSGPSAETGATPKTRAAKTSTPKAKPVTAKRAGAGTAEAHAGTGTSAATRGRAARKQADPAREKASVLVDAPKARRKPAARGAANGTDPVVYKQPSRGAPRKDVRKPRQTPVSTPAPATLVADIPMSTHVAAAAKPTADGVPVKRAVATFGAPPDRILSETMEIAQIGFAANLETLQALVSARTPAEVLEVQVRGMQIMAEVWTRQAARIQDLYVTTVRGHRS